ncbi:DUF6702 family protein [Flavobacterium sp.]|uniref:DUF6702 family protein n=1 Tax=Flavobacterium sp. TaxID=239 RepID=UPI0025C22B27|nr:DUF6702 family protein [Flavobacterium sp.]MBA4152968.1 hypothetical protein [Flavobacterium sp.]
MRKKIKIVFIAIFFIGLSSFTMHKFYVSVTQINFVPEKKTIQITARFFIDDLNNALEKKHKTKFYLGSSKESVVQLEQFKKYISDNFSIKVNAKYKEIQFVQKEIEDDVFIIYLKVSDVSKVNSIDVKNTLLFDFIVEQQNIIHTQVLNKKQSALLTPDNPNELLNY